MIFWITASQLNQTDSKARGCFMLVPFRACLASSATFLTCCIKLTLPRRPSCYAATGQVWLPSIHLSLFRFCWWFRPCYMLRRRYFATDLDLWSSYIIKTQALTSWLWRCFSISTKPAIFFASCTTKSSLDDLMCYMIEHSYTELSWRSLCEKEKLLNL